MLTKEEFKAVNDSMGNRGIIYEELADNETILPGDLLASEANVFRMARAGLSNYGDGHHTVTMAKGSGYRTVLRAVPLVDASAAQELDWAWAHLLAIGDNMAEIQAHRKAAGKIVGGKEADNGS